MTWPYWLAIGAAMFALGTLVDERIGRALDWLIAFLLASILRPLTWRT